MFIVDPGDMIFVPMFVWRTYPVEQKLDNDIELMEIRLTKAETVVQEKLHRCNGKRNYIYGGKRVYFWQQCKIIDTHLIIYIYI